MAEKKKWTEVQKLQSKLILKMAQISADMKVMQDAHKSSSDIFKLIEDHDWEVPNHYVQAIDSLLEDLWSWTLNEKSRSLLSTLWALSWQIQDYIASNWKATHEEEVEMIAASDIEEEPLEDHLENNTEWVWDDEDIIQDIEWIESSIEEMSNIKWVRLLEWRDTFLRYHNEVLGKIDWPKILEELKKLNALIQEHPRNLDYFETALIYSQTICVFDQKLWFNNTALIHELQDLIWSVEKELDNKLLNWYFDISNNEFLTHMTRILSLRWNKFDDWGLSDNDPWFLLLSNEELLSRVYHSIDIWEEFQVFISIVFNKTIGIKKFDELPRVRSWLIQKEVELLITAFEILKIEILLRESGKDDFDIEQPEHKSQLKDLIEKIIKFDVSALIWSEYDIEDTLLFTNDALRKSDLSRLKTKDDKRFVSLFLDELSKITTYFSAFKDINEIFENIEINFNDQHQGWLTIEKIVDDPTYKAITEFIYNWDKGFEEAFSKMNFSEKNEIATHLGLNRTIADLSPDTPQWILHRSDIDQEKYNKTMEKISSRSSANDLEESLKQISPNERWVIWNQVLTDFYTFFDECIIHYKRINDLFSSQKGIETIFDAIWHQTWDLEILSKSLIQGLSHFTQQISLLLLTRTFGWDTTLRPYFHYSIARKYVWKNYRELKKLHKNALKFYHNKKSFLKAVNVGSNISYSDAWEKFIAEFEKIDVYERTNESYVLDLAKDFDEDDWENLFRLNADKSEMPFDEFMNWEFPTLIDEEDGTTFLVTRINTAREYLLTGLFPKAIIAEYKGKSYNHDMRSWWLYIWNMLFWRPISTQELLNSIMHLPYDINSKTVAPFVRKFAVDYQLYDLCLETYAGWVESYKKLMKVCTYFDVKMWTTMSILVIKLLHHMSVEDRMPLETESLDHKALNNIFGSAYLNILQSQYALIQNSFKWHSENFYTFYETQKERLLEFFINIVFSQDIVSTDWLTFSQQIIELLSWSHFDDLTPYGISGASWVKYFIIEWLWKHIARHTEDGYEFLDDFSSDELWILIDSMKSSQENFEISSELSFKKLSLELYLRAERYDQVKRILISMKDEDEYKIYNQRLIALKFKLNNDFEEFMQNMHEEILWEEFQSFFAEGDLVGKRRWEIRVDQHFDWGNKIDEQDLHQDSNEETQKDENKETSSKSSDRANNTQISKRSKKSKSRKNSKKERSEKKDTQLDADHLRNTILLRYRDLLWDHPANNLSDEELWALILQHDAKVNKLRKLEHDPSWMKTADDTSLERLKKWEIFERITLCLWQFSTLLSKDKIDVLYQHGKKNKKWQTRIIDGEYQWLREVKLWGHPTYTLEAVPKYHEFLWKEWTWEKLKILIMENNDAIKKQLKKNYSEYDNIEIVKFDRVLPFHALHNIERALNNWDSMGLDMENERKWIAAFLSSNKNQDCKTHFLLKRKINDLWLSNADDIDLTSSLTWTQHSSRRKVSYIDENLFDHTMPTLLVSDVSELDHRISFLKWKVLTDELEESQNDLSGTLSEVVETLEKNWSLTWKKVLTVMLTQILKLPDISSKQARTLTKLCQQILTGDKHVNFDIFPHEKSFEYIWNIRERISKSKGDQENTEHSSVVLWYYQELWRLVDNIREYVFDERVLRFLDLLIWDIYKDISCSHTFTVDGIGNSESIFQQCFDTKRKVTIPTIHKKLALVNHYLWHLKAKDQESKITDDKKIHEMRSKIEESVLFADMSPDIETNNKYLVNEKWYYEYKWIWTLPSIEDKIIENGKSKKDGEKNQWDHDWDSSSAEIDWENYEHNDSIVSISNNLNIVLRWLEKEYNESNAIDENYTIGFTLDDIVDAYINLCAINKIQHRRYDSREEYAVNDDRSVKTNKQVQDLKSLVDKGKSTKMTRRMKRLVGQFGVDSSQVRLAFKLWNTISGGSWSASEEERKRFFKFEKNDKTLFARNYRYLVDINEENIQKFEREWKIKFADNLRNNHKKSWKKRDLQMKLEKKSEDSQE